MVANGGDYLKNTESATQFIWNLVGGQKNGTIAKATAFFL